MPESLQEFYDRHKDFVYSYALCAFAGNVREAKRFIALLFREFFEQAEKNPKHIKDEELHSLLRRRVRSYIRDHQKLLRDMPPPSSYQTRLQAALGDLPQLQQECVLFKYIYGLTPRPLSRLLDKTEPSIRQNLSRGTKRIFELMEEDHLDSRTFRIPLAQIPTSVDQRLKLAFNTPLPSIELPIESFTKRLGQIKAFVSRKKIISFGIILIMIGGFGEFPKFVYKQEWIVPGNFLYSWKKNMELEKLEALRRPANISNFYLSLSNRRIKEAYHLSKKHSLLSYFWPEAFAQEYEPKNFPTITFDVNPNIAPQSSLVAESALMIQRAMEYAGSIDQPTTMINVLKNIRTALETQQDYLAEITRWSREPQMAPMTESISLIHHLNVKIIENAGQQVAEQALAAEAHFEPISGVPLRIVLHQEAEKSLGPVAESIQIHQQFRPMIRPQDEAIKSFAEVVLEVDHAMTAKPISTTATIDSLMQQIESIHFPGKAKSSATKDETTESEEEIAESKTDGIEDELFETEETLSTTEPQATNPTETAETNAEVVGEITEKVEEALPKAESKTPETVEEIIEVIEEAVESKKPETTEVEPLPEVEVQTEQTPETPVEEAPKVEVKEAPKPQINQIIDTDALKSLSGTKKETEPAVVPVEVPAEPTEEAELQEEPVEEEVEIQS